MMGREIERKFLLKGDFRPFAVKKIRIRQGYLSMEPERIVRIRIAGSKGYVTIKGLPDTAGVNRFEWEKEIPFEEAETLLKMCLPEVIDKTRYIVPEKSGLKFEVDEFYGDNEGLTVAEIELPSEDHPFEKPEWLGEEVTGKQKYYNASLSRKPFKDW